INRLRYDMKALEAKNNFLTYKDDKGRKVASIPRLSKEKDWVKYDVYNWAPDKMKAIAEKEFKYKNYGKSAQFYHELILRFPEDKEIDDKVLLKGGISAYESKQNYDWAIKHLENLLKRYPHSSYYRGAKL